MSLASLTVNQVYSAIKRAGAKVVLTRTTPGAGFPDPVTNEIPSTTQTVSTYAIPDASSLQGLGFKFGQDLIQGGEIQLSIPAKGLTFEPEAGDKIEFRAKTYTVKGSKPTFYGDTPVKFDLLVRL